MPPDPPIHSRRERKKLETRNRIFSEAFGLFIEKGFDAVTVEEIAERADVGKGTVFNYFPQKTAFLIAAYSEWVELMREELGPVESWEGPVRAKLARLFSFLIDRSVENRVLSRQIIFENMRQTHQRMILPEAEGTDGDETQDPDPKALRLLEEMVREVIRRGKAEAEIRPEADEAQAASLIAAAAFHTMVRGLVRNESPREMEAALAAKMEIIFTGLNP
jgi:AcrR family transcriptional regulator